MNRNQLHRAVTSTEWWMAHQAEVAAANDRVAELDGALTRALQEHRAAVAEWEKEVERGKAGKPRPSSDGVEHLGNLLADAERHARDVAGREKRVLSENGHTAVPALEEVIAAALADVKAALVAVVDQQGTVLDDALVAVRTAVRLRLIDGETFVQARSQVPRWSTRGDVLAMALAAVLAAADQPTQPRDRDEHVELRAVPRESPPARPTQLLDIAGRVTPVDTRTAEQINAGRLLQPGDDEVMTDDDDDVA